MKNILTKNYQKSRYSMVAKNGMVCASNPLASQAGLEILKKGGNAVDAAIATAAVMAVVEPTSNGIGSDSFALVWMKNKLYGINGSGYSPKKMTENEIRNLGYDKIPERGWIPVMIPGTPKTWARLIERFGNLSLLQVLEPAIKYATEGFPISPALSFLWKKYVLKAESEKNNPIYREWFKTFTKDGKPFEFGDVVHFSDMAKTLQLIGETNADAFYKGEIAEAIVSQSKRDGGLLEIDDLCEYDVTWVDPISVNYRGYDVWEIPPNGQGIVALSALNILNNFQFDTLESINTYHAQFESIKQGFFNALKYVTDPKDMKIDFHKYLDPEYGEMVAKMIGKKNIIDSEVEPFGSGTVYMCTADKDGNMVSYIQSNYMDFGARIVIENYGISLQNRGKDFSLNKDDANYVKPRKKSYHTIIPGFITKDDNPIGPFGVMGGYMQPQGHVQVLMNYIDFGLSPQDSLDAPRWQWKKDNTFIVEPEFNEYVIDELRKLGYKIEIADNCFSFGRGQMIVKLNDIYIGGCESRTDSSIACY